jgi:hypothetical protein
MVFYVGGAAAGAEAFSLVLDEEFADNMFAEAVWDTSVYHAWCGRGRMETYFDTCCAPCPSGKGTSSRRIFANVAFRFLPLKGVVPNNISYISMPSVHQSTALVCPHPLITSGAMYSSVPTKEFVRKFAIHDFVSMAGMLCDVPLRLAKRMPGRPPESDCLERSKSDNIMWPD